MSKLSKWAEARAFIHNRTGSVGHDLNTAVHQGVREGFMHAIEFLEAHMLAEKSPGEYLYSSFDDALRLLKLYAGDEK